MKNASVFFLGFSQCIPDDKLLPGIGNNSFLVKSNSFINLRTYFVLVTVWWWMLRSQIAQVVNESLNLVKETKLIVVNI